MGLAWLALPWSKETKTSENAPSLRAAALTAAIKIKATNFEIHCWLNNNNKLKGDKKDWHPWDGVVLITPRLALPWYELLSSTSVESNKTPFYIGRRASRTSVDRLHHTPLCRTW